VLNNLHTQNILITIILSKYLLVPKSKPRVVLPLEVPTRTGCSCLAGANCASTPCLSTEACPPSPPSTMSTVRTASSTLIATRSCAFASCPPTSPTMRPGPSEKCHLGRTFSLDIFFPSINFLYNDFGFLKVGHF
jgi:hypothetical protein